MLNLTQQEKKVILFLTAIALCGMGIDFYNKICSRIKPLAYFNRDPGKININQADQETLVILPGIGEKLAQRIIDYRIKNGYFPDIEELKKIKGITDYRFEKIKQAVSIE